MNKTVILLICLQVLMGCGPSSKPATIRPSESALLGTWQLESSPNEIPRGASLSVGKNCTLFLSSNGVAKLKDVLVEDVTLRDGQPPVIQWRQKTETCTWGVNEWHRQNESSVWRVSIRYDTNREMYLQINEDDNGESVLFYRPDPEMADAFVYRRRTQGAN